MPNHPNSEISRRLNRANGHLDHAFVTLKNKMQGRSMMKKIDLEAMPVDDLWSLHERSAGFFPQGSRPKSVNSRGAWLFSIGPGMPSRGETLPNRQRQWQRPTSILNGFFRNIAILRRRPKRGQAAASNRAG
jgi:hypothetical protein